MADKKQLGVRIETQLYRRLRVLAARQDKTIGELAEEAITDLLAKYAGRRAAQ